KCGGACGLGKYGGRPTLGTCAHCPDNTAAEIWPVITVRGEKLPPRQPPPPAPVPTPEAQTAWRLRVLPICQSCPAFGGVEETPAMKITHRMRCSECRVCGSSTI